MDNKPKEQTERVADAVKKTAELKAIKPKKLSKREQNALIARGEFDPLSVIKEVLYREIEPSLKKIIEIRDDPKSTKKEQMEASKYVVDVSINLVELDRINLKPDDSVNNKIVAILSELSMPAKDQADKAKEVKASKNQVIDAEIVSEED